MIAFPPSPDPAVNNVISISDSDSPIIPNSINIISMDFATMFAHTSHLEGFPGVFLSFDIADENPTRILQLHSSEEWKMFSSHVDALLRSQGL